MQSTGRDQAPWLLLLYQFPAGPDSRRVRIWRRLQGIGAVAIKNSVYALPLSEQSREDFAWLLKELQSNGADGAILESHFVDGMSDQQVRQLFNEARDADYLLLQRDIENSIAARPEDATHDDPASSNAGRSLARARKRMAEIDRIDFFGAAGRDAADAALQALARHVSNRSEPADKEQKMAAAPMQDLTGRVWVTRRGVRVDRIASAWLIRRWIDASARFKFVAGQEYSPSRGEVRFDMANAEFTHEGNLCTFEVLTRLIGPDDAALNRVGEIVHDIDLKDARFDRPETEGIAHVLEGIIAGTDDDEQRLARGSALLEDLYRYFRMARN